MKVGLLWMRVGLLHIIGINVSQFTMGGSWYKMCESWFTVNIYILNVATLDETIIPSCLHFSMQNIEQSRGLGRASRWSNVNVNQ